MVLCSVKQTGFTFTKSCFFNAAGHHTVKLCPT
jgi:hypothetical protein